MNISIYLIKDEFKRDFGHWPWQELWKLVGKPKLFPLDKYEMIYEMNAADLGDTFGSNIQVLEQLYFVLNHNPPVDYQQRSMSMGDVVRLERSYYYCDIVGFTEIIVEDPIIYSSYVQK